MFYDFRCSFIYEQKGLKNSVVNAKNVMTAVSKKIKIKDYFSGYSASLSPPSSPSSSEGCCSKAIPFRMQPTARSPSVVRVKKGQDDQERSKHNRPGYIPTRCKSLCYLTQYFDVLLPQNCTLNYKNGFYRSFQNQVIIIIMTYLIGSSSNT